jgi:hypothetical protein
VPRARDNYETACYGMGIAACMPQAGLFSGFNLAFIVSRMRLDVEVEAPGGSRDAQKVLRLQKNSNLMLAKISRS